MTDNPEALLPCPFCGDEQPALDHETDTGAWTVRCTHCGIRINDFAGERSARSAWNRRAALAQQEATPAPAELEREMREQLRHLIDELTHCPLPDDSRRTIRPGAELMFSNMVNACARLLAAPPATPAPADERDAARYRLLCSRPDWRFIEMLCQQFAASSAAEFKAGMDRVIDALVDQPAPGFPRRWCDYECLTHCLNGCPHDAAALEGQW